MISHAPAGRIAAVLEPVRALAGEIMIAADARVDESTLAGYAGLADRVFRIEYQQSERHFAWLHAQCTGDWILRLDHDEVVSRALADRLPELLASRDVQQYWFRRAWVFPDAAQVLDDPPWSVDFNNRLVRNDATLRVGALQHSGVHPVDPHEYVEEPLYHLELVVSDHASRRDKAITYEVARPLMVAPGGGRMNEAFYLPELRESLRTVTVPDEDRARVQAVLDATGAVEPGPTGDVPLVPLAEMDWHRGGRRIPESGYRAAIEPVGAPPVLAPGEGRQVLFRVANQGSELWSYGRDADPEAVHAAFDRLLAGREAAALDVDTRLARDKPGRRSAAEVEALLAVADVVLTTRPQGLVLALRAGIPALAVDVIAGGSQLLAHAGALGWPAALAVDALDDAVLDEQFAWCLSQEARTLAGTTARRGLDELGAVRAALEQTLG
jgi:hypothetical protein